MFSTDDEIVRATYNVLLGRDPEPAGLRHWSAALHGGLTREEFVHAVLSSLEFREKGQLNQTFNKYEGVDLVIPVMGYQLRVPASDLSLVPHLLDHRSWEPHLTRYLTDNLGSADVFMDVGANLGYYTVLCGLRAKRVIAFEPVRNTHDYCKANIELNHLDNVELYQCGLWYEEVTASIRADPSSVMSASISQGDSLASESIKCVSLDDMIARGGLELPRLDIVKMDIEGAEASALAGMLKTIEKLRPTIVMELNRPALARFGKGTSDIWNFFRKIHYRIEAFENWQAADSKPVDSLEQLEVLCPPDSLIDVLALG